MHFAIEAAGWAGAILILASYVLLSAGRMEGRAPGYQLMNLLGAAGIAANSGYNGAVPSAVLNVIWMGIAVLALVRLRFTRA